MPSCHPTQSRGRKSDSRLLYETACTQCCLQQAQPVRSCHRSRLKASLVKVSYRLQWTQTFFFLGGCSRLLESLNELGRAGRRNLQGISSVDGGCNRSHWTNAPALAPPVLAYSSEQQTGCWSSKVYQTHLVVNQHIRLLVLRVLVLAGGNLAAGAQGVRDHLQKQA